MTTLRVLAVALGSALLSLPSQAVPVITVTPWLAPNAFGSPSFASAQANAVNGMITGNNGGGVATGSGPQAFTPQTTTVNSAEVVVTGFNSWHGVTNPGAAFGAAYANELGNRMTFALFINGGGTQFSISQLGFSASSSDAGNLLGFSFVTGSYSYSAGYVGILFGADGQLGGGDDQYITNGPATQLVDALAGRGSGNSLAAYCPDAPAVCDDAAQAAAIADAAAAFGPGTTTFTGTYTLSSVTGGELARASGSFAIATPDTVPEPTSIVLALTGLALLGAARRPREAAAAAA